MFKDLADVVINLLNRERDQNGSPVFDKIVSKRQLKNNTSTNKIVKHFFSLKKLCYINVCSGQEERE